MAYKTTILCVFLEILFFLISVIIAVVATHLFLHKVDGLQPFKRGFFCDDDSIKYPVKKDSLSILDIIKVGVVVSLGLVRLTCNNCIITSPESLYSALMNMRKDAVVAMKRN